MPDVISFKPKKAEYVYECLCGEQTFYLFGDGTIECYVCKRRQPYPGPVDGGGHGPDRGTGGG